MSDRDIFITFDMDWASDEVLGYFYEMLQPYDIDATINVTHPTEMLEKFRADKRIELGIHPNFNFLLDGQENQSTDKSEIINNIKKIVPEAITSRSHSLVKSTPITANLKENGIKYELNSFIPPVSGTVLYPWVFESVVEVPFIFEDDLYMMENYDETVEYYLSDSFSMLRVFNFHPIHLFLNTDEMIRYQKAKKYYHNYDKLVEYQNKNNEKGTCVFFKGLIETAIEKGYVFKKIKDINIEI